MTRRPESRWTPQSEQRALERLRSEHPIVLIYARQSRSDFDDDGNPKGPSLEQQKEDCSRLPEIAGCPVEFFQDADRSARERRRLEDLHGLPLTAKRTGWNAMMARIDTAPAGSIGAVAVHEGSRLNRKPAINFFKLMAGLEERGILVLDVKREIRNADKLGWKMRAIFWEDEGDRLSGTITANLQHLKRQGRPLGRAGCGYKNVNDGKGNKSIVVNPEMVPSARKAFDLYATGKFSEMTLVQHLNDMGVVGQSKGRWKVGSVKAMLQNPIYIGEPRGVVGDCSHLAIIDRETFARCERVRLKHQTKKSGWKGRTNPYSLGSLVACGRCGGPLHGRTRVWKVNGEERRSAFYRCGRTYMEHPHTCDQPPVREGAVERVIVQALGYCANPEQVDPNAVKRLEVGIRRPDDPRKALRVRLKNLDKEAEQLTWLFQRSQLGETDEENKLEYLRRNGLINDRRVAAREEIERAPEADAGWCRDKLGTLIEVWSEADAGQRNALLSEVFESIVVSQDVFGLAVTLVPRAEWLGFFRGVVGPGEGKTGRLAKALASGGEAVTGRR